MDHLIECLEQFAQKMGGVHARSVVEHGLAVSRRDGQGRAERKQDPEPHLERTWYLFRRVLRGGRACAPSHMCPPDSLSARLNANAALPKRDVDVEGGWCFPSNLPLFAAPAVAAP